MDSFGCSWRANGQKKLIGMSKNPFYYSNFRALTGHSWHVSEHVGSGAKKGVWW